METDNDPPDKKPPPDRKPPPDNPDNNTNNPPTIHTIATSINATTYTNLIDNSINFANSDKLTPTTPLRQPDPMTLLATALSQDTKLNPNSMDITAIKAVLARLGHKPRQDIPGNPQAKILENADDDTKFQENSLESNFTSKNPPNRPTNQPEPSYIPMEGAHDPNFQIRNTPQEILTRHSNLEISQSAKSQENSHDSNFTPKNSTNQLTNQPNSIMTPTEANNDLTLSVDGLPHKNSPGASYSETSRNPDLHPNSLLVQNTPKNSTNHPANHTQPSHIPMEGAYIPNLNIGDTPHATSIRPSNFEISQNHDLQPNSLLVQTTTKNSTNHPANHTQLSYIPKEGAYNPNLNIGHPSCNFDPTFKSRNFAICQISRKMPCNHFHTQELNQPPHKPTRLEPDAY